MNGIKQLTIQINNRLHLSLISLHNNGYRKNGGFGFSISEPFLTIDGNFSSKFEIIDYRENGFSSEQKNRLIDILENLYSKKSFKHKCLIEINGDTPSHKGFGSGTSIRLACIEMLYLLNECLYTTDEIVKESLRGGTSGVGINTYFHGGLVLDIGHSEKNNTFLPSNSLEKSRHLLPLMLLQENMPNWDIGICIPSDIPFLNEKKEKEFFQQTCPIEPHQSYESLYHIIFGLIGAIKENDLETFAKALLNLQSCKWKSSERDIYQGRIQIIEKKLYDCGALGVGMSSLGPSLFFVGKDIDEIVHESKKELLNCMIFKTKTNNSGRIILDNGKS